LGGKTLLVP
jgi:transcription elongation factor SPT5